MVFGRLPLIEVAEKIAAFGEAVPLLYVVAYALLVTIFFPASVLTLAAGAVFGLGMGTAVCSAGSTLGAALSFLVSRYLARSWIARKMKANAKFLAIDKAVANEGWRVVALTRLSPIFPFGVINYVFGITAIRFFPYVLSSWLAMIPGTVLYVYFGTLGRFILEGRERGVWEWVLSGLGLCATIAVIVLITRSARRAMQDMFRETE